ncbi:hypothetical protein [Thiomicrorhabdus aquaedulcis]|uniref:hypothetical protein n=1 Tax=Thiomicrorhabdus aquaedulcis TaxID=2211106 RepID=UPI000FDB1CE7|nr:hypothetical protein [Thiomicrorhabdus aquaedulcis]
MEHESHDALFENIEDEEDDIELASKMEDVMVSTLETSTHTKRQMISIAPSLVLKAEEVMLDARLKRDKPYLTHIAKLLKSYLDHSLMKDERIVDDDLVSRVKALSKKFPNFTPVVDIVATSLRVCQHGQKPLHITPVLIVGEPGIGKTEFLLSLASALGLEREFVDASTMQGSFTLAGTEQHWSVNTFSYLDFLQFLLVGLALFARTLQAQYNRSSCVA